MQPEEKGESQDRPQHPPAGRADEGPDQHQDHCGGGTDVQMPPHTCACSVRPGTEMLPPKEGGQHDPTAEEHPTGPEVAGPTSRPNHRAGQHDKYGEGDRECKRRRRWPACCAMRDGSGRNVAGTHAATFSVLVATSASLHPRMRQPRSPSRATTAGSATPRTRVASSSTAAARPTPSCLNVMTPRVAKMENTATMTIAALVTVPAVAATPSAAALRGVRPLSRASRMRSRMSTV